MQIDLNDPLQYTILANSANRNGFINRLTIFYDDGEARIEEIPQHEQSSISSLEFDGRAFSFTLPEIVTPVDMERLREVFAPLIDAQDWDGVKDTANELWRAVDFADDLIDCAYETPVTEDEWADLIARHGADAAAIEADIRQCGADFIDLAEWISTRIGDASA